MKYIGMPMGMWLLFHRSFREAMVGVLGFSESAATETEKRGGRSLQVRAAVHVGLWRVVLRLRI